MTQSERIVLEYLRALYEDDYDMSNPSTGEIADELSLTIKDLFDPDYDTGILFNLSQEGWVWKFKDGNRYYWQAAGARTVWDG